MSKVATIIEQLDVLSGSDLDELANAFATRVGVTAALVRPEKVEPEALQVEVQPPTLRRVMLTGFPIGQRIPVVKVVKELLKLSTMEGMNLVDHLPALLISEASLEQVEEVVFRLEAVGAKLNVEVE